MVGRQATGRRRRTGRGRCDRFGRAELARSGPRGGRGGDGTELTEQKNTYSGQKPPVFDRVSIGIWQYHPPPILSDMWIDDIRVSSRRNRLQRTWIPDFEVRT